MQMDTEPGSFEAAFPGRPSLKGTCEQAQLDLSEALHITERAFFNMCKYLPTGKY